MTPHDLIAAFEDLAEAPDGAKRLRELVLQLAVRGKLVPSAADEWPMATLSELVEDLQNGTSSRGGEGGPSVVVLRLADIKRGRIVPDSFREIDLSVGSAEKYRVRAGDVLAIRVNGSGDLVGRMVLVERSEGWCYCDHLIRIRLRLNTLSPRFLSLFGETPDARQHLASVTVTTAGQKTVNQKGLGSLRVPVPPLAEQHRIVARVDELMGLLDRLEAARTTRDEVRRAARDAALAALRYAEDTEAVEAAWGRIAREMDTLFTEPEDVGPLRQAVLGLAVRGRLVAQDPNEEPSPSLLRRIEVAKMHLRREGQLGREKALSPVEAEPFNLPEGWCWTRAGNLMKFVTSGSRGWAAHYTEVGAPFLRIGNLDYGTRALDLAEIQRVCPPENAEGTRTRTQGGDVLVSITGDTGMVGVVPDELEVAYINQHIALSRPVFPEMADYVATSFMSPHGLEQFWGRERGIKNSLGLEDVREALVPVPPLAEQHRIVAKVDALMGLCDDLEARLTAARDLQAQFAAAAVHHLDV